MIGRDKAVFLIVSLTCLEICFMTSLVPNGFSQARTTADSNQSADTTRLISTLGIEHIQVASLPMQRMVTKIPEELAQATDAFTGKPSRKAVNVNIVVSPEEAKDAAVTVVQKSKMTIEPGSITVSWITPDTIGTWRAPLSLALLEGDYDVAATKAGFRCVEESIKLYDTRDREVSMDMLSLEYLRRQREQWGTCKWISAGVAACAGLSTLFFYERIGTYTNRYNTAVGLSDIQADKNSVRTNQNSYRISSTVAFSAVGSFLITWLIQSLYHE